MNLSEAMLDGFVSRARRALKLKGSINVLVTSGAEMRSFNRRFRGKNKATDVLSFPSESSGVGKRPAAGEIAISAEIAAQNATNLGHTVATEVKILALHGMLHLAGFDHELDDGQMLRKETMLRRRFRLPPGLIERTKSPASRGKAI
ncbi:MAG TPA: rRNA maturation RNase YbeY [Candidatus Sulfotelmatobacter sp.]